VHNGIISNRHALRADLVRRRHRFSSETNTEVLAHLMAEIYAPGVSVEEAFIKTLPHLEGTFAVVMISCHEVDKLFCAREKSPLILGIASDDNFVGSDLNAFLPYTWQSIILDGGEYAVLSQGGYCIRGIADGEVKRKRIAEIDWNMETAEKGGHRHYTEKEIWEQLEVLRRAMAIPQKEIAALARLMHEVRRNILIGVGTTYCVALFGQYLLASLAGNLPRLSVQIQNWFFLGRGMYTPIAFEAALKMKEVTYLHAEGMPAGFLKHGTLSLIDHESRSVFLVPPKEQSQLYDLTLSSMEKVHARGGRVIAVDFDDVCGHVD
jgi:glucosamine 6-phosphate synthetase-like amidotransferase/phosphosugar isomerase protein